MSLLPDKKKPPTLDFAGAKVLLYGAPKVGKTTLVSQLPGEVLILACEPGTGGLETFDVEIDSWDTFRKVGAELAASDRFTTIAIDTVDELYRMCSDQVCADMGIDYPGDADYGKGWAGVRDEFRLRVGKLASLNRGVWFISHAHEMEIKSRIGTRNKTVPTLNRRALEFIHGFCDLILYAESVQTDEGEKRQLRTAASEQFEAGGRITLTDPLPLDAAALKKDIDRASKGAK